MSKLTKQARNSIKENGFQSAAQARLLMMWARDYPAKYDWVWDVVRDHGIPEKEQVDNVHWEGPYNVSPTTPSYTYVAKMKLKLVKFAQMLDDAGFEEEAEKLDVVLMDKKNPREVANSFWAVRGSEIKKNDSDSILRAFSLLESFDEYKELDPADQEEAKRTIGDKILGRDNELA